MNAAAFSAESLGFTVRKVADFSRGVLDPVVDVAALFPDAGKMPEGNPTMTDEVRHIAIELIGASGRFEIPVRHIEETGGRHTVSGVRHSVGTLTDCVLSGTHTKKEWRVWRSL